MDKKMTQEEMVKEAVEEAKKAAEEQDAAQEAAGEDTEAVAEETVEEEADSEASEEEALEETAEEGSEKGAKGLFKRKPKKDKKDEQIEELKDKLTRQMAEFDNFRKRTEKEKSAMYEIGAKDIIEKILPVVDNFERGLGAVTEEQKEDSFVSGMEMIYKQIMTTLDSVGVKAIEAVGNEFDPDFHNAVMHVEDEEIGENIVVEEFQKGYTYRDTVVRHSMVNVCSQNSSDDPAIYNKSFGYIQQQRWIFDDLLDLCQIKQQLCPENSRQQSPGSHIENRIRV